MRRAVLLFSLLLAPSTSASAQQVDEGRVVLALETMLGNDASLAKEARQAWVVFSERPHGDEERALLVKLWPQRADLPWRRALLFAMRFDGSAEIRALREAQLAQPDHVELLALSLEGLGFNGGVDVPRRLASYFGHTDSVVRVSAVSAFLALVERFSGVSRGYGFTPNARATRLFRAYRGSLEALLDDPVVTVRAGALRGLLMLSAAPFEAPLERLRAAARAKPTELREVCARAGLSKLGLELLPELLCLLADPEPRVVEVATLALWRWAGLDQPRASRERVLVALRAELARPAGLAQRSPRMLVLLADDARRSGERERALSLYDRAARVAARGRNDPPLRGQVAGPTALLAIAQLELDAGRQDAARAALKRAHQDFSAEAPVLGPSGASGPLFKALEAFGKRLEAGLGFEPGGPPRADGRGAEGREGPGHEGHDHEQQPGSRPSEPKRGGR
jgi:hypothetical protein